MHNYVELLPHFLGDKINHCMHLYIPATDSYCWPAAVKTAASSLTFQSDVPHAGVGPVTVDGSAQVLASKAATQGRHSQGTGKGVHPMGLFNGDTWRKRRRQGDKDLKIMVVVLVLSCLA